MRLIGASCDSNSPLDVKPNSKKNSSTRLSFRSSEGRARLVRVASKLAQVGAGKQSSSGNVPRPLPKVCRARLLPAEGEQGQRLGGARAMHAGVSPHDVASCAFMAFPTSTDTRMPDEEYRVKRLSGTNLLIAWQWILGGNNRRIFRMWQSKHRRAKFCRIFFWVPKTKGMLKENANPHKGPTKKASGFSSWCA